MSLEKLKLPASGVIAVVGLQWGDEGKGKIVDLFAEWADVTARGTGGANAGHTIVVGGDSHVFHLVPSAILRDAQGVINVIGRGVALDPGVLLQELALLHTLRVSYGNLKISRDAHLVLPHHKVLDRVREAHAGDGKIGTTGKGIGPVFADHVSRHGLFVRDMLNPSSFRKKLVRTLDAHAHELQGLSKYVHEAMNADEQLRDMCSADGCFDVDRIVERYCKFGAQLRPYIADTDALLQSAIAKGKRVLLEGAQATLLSIDHGLYPMVTSSDSTIDGLCKGVGLSRTQVDQVFGVVKAPYMTRVGSGVFPTQIDDDEGAEVIRTAGNEFGATTGRPRRIGWLDLPLLRYAVQFGADNLVLTKIDVLSGFGEIRICTGYVYTGPDYDLGDQVLRSGQSVGMAFGDDALMQSMKPIWENFPGWEQDISQLRSGDDVPLNLQKITNFISEAVGRPVVMLSVGPERDQTVCL